MKILMMGKRLDVMDGHVYVWKLYLGLQSY
jgi:hypothetical protein